MPRRIWDQTIGPDSAQRPEHELLIDWAQYHGLARAEAISPEPAEAGTLADWLLRKGPSCFGYSFDLDYWIVRELQLTGRIAELNAGTGGL